MSYLFDMNESKVVMDWIVCFLEFFHWNFVEGSELHQRAMHLFYRVYLYAAQAILLSISGWFHWFLSSIFIWKLCLSHFRSSHSSTTRSTLMITMPVVCPLRATTWMETPLSWSAICSWPTLENTTVRSRLAANTTGAKSTSLCWVRLIFLESAPNRFLHQPASLWFDLIIQITKFGHYWHNLEIWLLAFTGQTLSALVMFASLWTVNGEDVNLKWWDEGALIELYLLKTEETELEAYVISLLLAKQFTVIPNEVQMSFLWFDILLCLVSIIRPQGFQAVIQAQYLWHHSSQPREELERSMFLFI